MTLHKSPIGLDGVAAAETALSHVDGDKGELVIAGRRVADLAFDTNFEALAAQLWTLAGLPVDEHDASRLIGEARERAFTRLPAHSAGQPGHDASRRHAHGDRGDECRARH